MIILSKCSLYSWFHSYGALSIMAYYNQSTKWPVGLCNDHYCEAHSLVEDYLPNFVKFNSNTMCIDRFSNLCIQAFSHWTYHHSNGEYMFVDCQGRKDRSGYTLTDPVIVSKSFWTSSYGPCDGGKDMMITWFQNHRCNSYCRRQWKRAYGRKSAYIKPTPKTTYVWQTQQYKNEASQGHCLNSIQEY
eukprot:222178_1